MQEDKTRLYGEFLRAVDRMRPTGPDDAFALSTLFNLRDYDISAVTQPKPFEKPGGMLCLYMFYARLFHKLQSRVPGVMDKVGLSDFVSKHTMQRIWRTVVRIDDQDRCFKARLNLDQFEELLVVLADQLYAAPKWNLVTREKRMQRLIEVLQLESPKMVKAQLFDAYRDHHLHKYDELHSFEEVYHRHVLLALPSTPVIPLTHDRRVHFLEDGPVLQLFKRLEWMDPQKQWEQFQAPFIDMGVMSLGASREFRIDVLNLRYHMLELSFSTEGLDPVVELSFFRKPITAGGRGEVILRPKPTCCGEWTGFVEITGEVPQAV